MMSHFSWVCVSGGCSLGKPFFFQTAKHSLDDRMVIGFALPIHTTNDSLLYDGMSQDRRGYAKLTCCKEYRRFSPKGDTILHAHTTSCHTWKA